MVFSDPQI